MTIGVTVNAKFIKEVIETSLEDKEIEGAIASALVLYKHSLGSYALEEDLQLEIKRYLAAHFVSLRDPSTRVEKEKIGDAMVEYSKVGDSDTASGLKSTRWGQEAITFDPTGVLLNLGKMPPKWYAL